MNRNVTVSVCSKSSMVTSPGIIGTIDSFFATRVQSVSNLLSDVHSDGNRWRIDLITERGFFIRWSKRARTVMFYSFQFLSAEETNRVWETLRHCFTPRFDISETRWTAKRKTGSTRPLTCFDACSGTRFLWRHFALVSRAVSRCLTYRRHG